MNAAVLIDASSWPKIVVDDKMITKLSIFVRPKAKTMIFPKVIYLSDLSINSPRTDVIFDIDSCSKKKFDYVIESMVKNGFACCF